MATPRTYDAPMCLRIGQRYVVSLQVRRSLQDVPSSGTTNDTAVCVVSGPEASRLTKAISETVLHLIYAAVRGLKGHKVANSVGNASDGFAVCGHGTLGEQQCAHWFNRALDVGMEPLRASRYPSIGHPKRYNRSAGHLHHRLCPTGLP